MKQQYFFLIPGEKAPESVTHKTAFIGYFQVMNILRNKSGQQADYAFFRRMFSEAFGKWREVVLFLGESLYVVF